MELYLVVDYDAFRLPWHLPLLFDFDVFKTFRAVAITTLPTELTVVNIFTAVARDTIF